MKDYEKPKVERLGAFRDITKLGGGACSDHPVGDAVACPTRS